MAGGDKMYVESITMKNFRCFEDASTAFVVPSSGTEALTAVLGDNGAGKSTVLRGIALSVLSLIIDQSGYVPRNLVRRDSDTPACVTTELSLGTEAQPSDADTRRRVELKILRKGSTERLHRVPDGDGYTGWEGMYEEESASFFLAAYGATRRVDVSETFDPVAQRKQRNLRYQRVAGIFEDHITLAPLHLWLARESETVVDAVTERLNAALPEEVDFTGRIDNASAIFKFHDAELPFEALSDGYRGFIGLVADLLYHLATVADGADLTSLSGVVLIDELDLHLHPTWQRTVAQRLTSAFPRLQFIITTHSPLIVGTLEREQIRVLDVEEVEDGYPRATIRVPAEDVHGLNVDDVLLSSYFGLSSTRAPDVKRRERDILLDAAGGDVEATRELLRKIAAKGSP